MDKLEEKYTREIGKWEEVLEYICHSTMVPENIAILLEPLANDKLIDAKITYLQYKRNKYRPKEFSYVNDPRPLKEKIKELLEELKEKEDE